MLKTIYNNCAGIDVHKKIIVVTIAKTDSNNITEYQTKSFPTFTEDLNELPRGRALNRSQND